MDLFSRIATLQREAAPVLKPVLPPRFAARVPGETAWGEESFETPALAASAAPLAAAVDARTEPGSSAAPVDERHAATPRQAGAAPQAGKPARPASAAQPAPAAPRVPADAAPPAQAGPDQQASMVQRQASVTTGTAAPALQPAAALQPAPARSAPARQPSTPPLSAARVQALSPQPAQATQTAAAPTVVHVHIDRIDVRAPAAAAPAPAPTRPARSAATHSLADYLRGEGHRS